MLFSLAVFSGLLNAHIIRAFPFRLGSDIAHREASNYPWAGAVLHSANNTYNSITASVVAPSLVGDDGSGILVSIGIDTTQACASGSFQIGFSARIENGQSTYSAWYHDWSTVTWNAINFDISAGDFIILTVNTVPERTGTIGNANSKAPPSQRVESVDFNSAYPVCGVNAGWLIEDISENGASLVNFDKIMFTRAEAGFTAGKASNFSADPFNILNITRNGQVMTSANASELTATIWYL